MKIRLFVIPLSLFTLLMTGCHLSLDSTRTPYTPVEKHLYTEGHMEDPLVKCELGHQKIYYVINNEHDEGGQTALVMTNCLTADHVEKLKILRTVPRQYSIDSSSDKDGQAKDQATTIVEEFRTPLPDLSAR